MKLPRFLSTRLASALVLGCALLAFAPLASAQAKVKVVPLTSAEFDKMSKFVTTINADPAAKAALEGARKDEDLATVMMAGGSGNDTVSSKYPKLASVFKSVGVTTDEFFTIVVSFMIANNGESNGTSDAAVAKANVAFYNANKEKIDKVMYHTID